jgi:hypothetical protein
MPQLIPVMERVRVARLDRRRPRTRPDHLGGDKAYSSRRNRRYLLRRQIKHTIPEPKNQRANRQSRGSKGGRPAGFDKIQSTQPKQAPVNPHLWAFLSRSAGLAERRAAHALHSLRRTRSSQARVAVCHSAGK